MRNKNKSFSEYKTSNLNYQFPWNELLRSIDEIEHEDTLVSLTIDSGCIVTIFDVLFTVENEEKTQEMFRNKIQRDYVSDDTNNYEKLLKKGINKCFSNMF